MEEIPIITDEPLKHFFLNYTLFDNDSLILEFGVWSGNTINYISSKTKQLVYGFDSFNGLPCDWERGDKTSELFKAGAFSRNNKLPKVNNNVILIKGLFNETLEPFLKKTAKKIQFIHIDCDLYESTKCVFDLCNKYFDDKVYIIFDEIFNYPNWENGEYKALIELIELLKNSYEYTWIGRFDKKDKIYKNELQKAHYGKALGFFKKIEKH